MTIHSLPTMKRFVGELSAIDARFEAQKLAFGPVVPPGRDGSKAGRIGASWAGSATGCWPLSSV